MTKTIESGLRGATPAANISKVLRQAVLACGSIVLLGGLISFLGYVLDMPRLADWSGNGISIQPNATLCVMFSGLSLMALASGRLGLGAAFGAVVLAIGGSTLLEWIAGVSFGHDGLLLFGRDWGRVGIVYPGRMGPPGSLCWTLLGSGLLVTGLSSRREGQRAAVVLALLTLFVVSFSLIGYVYGAQPMFSLPTLSVIALQTSAFILAASVGLTLLHPEVEPIRTMVDAGGAGILARRIVPSVVLVSIGLGFLRVLSQRTGLFDVATAVALFVILSIIVLAIPLWMALRLVQRHERGLTTLLEAHEEVARSLQEEDVKKDVFLATLAHELRNPLAPICNTVEFLKRTETEHPQLRTGYEIIERQSKQLTCLVDDLLDMSRIRRGILTLKTSVCDVRPLVHIAVDQVRPGIESARQQLEVRLPPEPVYAEVDPDRLSQVLGNLLVNAHKFTHDGGQMSISLRKVEGEAVFEVNDNGSGMLKSEVERVFDLFMQAGERISARPVGLGVGLALSQEIVQLHGGTITAISEGLGKGTTFEVRLPLCSAPDIEWAPAMDKPAEEASCRRILIVDDNEDAANTLALLLRLDGHEVVVAHRGEDALSLCELFRPEIAFLDLGMPGMDGFELARLIRASASHKEIKLVALTGWGSEKDVEDTRRSGIDAHLVKPVDFEQIRALIERFFSETGVR